MMQLIFKHLEIQAIENERLLGRLQYSLAGREMSILHTYAYDSGRGVGSQLVKAAQQWADAHRYTIIPICSFAQQYLALKAK